ncbi:hypothetical protein F5Y10DRAFT_277561 [Nemania abortiva]|nr:hypothetical protein F5Y10DRAFT_277561 [Nemania abortiva]
MLANGKGGSNGPDEVYPVHFIDQAGLVRSSLISYTFKYDYVLDAAKLHDSLAMLLSSGKWRKLGGRLRQRNGRLEIHVPKNFDNDRRPFRFSHVKFDTTDAHPLARRLPKSTGNRPSVQEGCTIFREFSIPSTLPNNIEHYLSTDEPLICLYINSFTDATLVSLTFPHSLSDAMGTAKLLQAWAHVLRENNVNSLDLRLEGAVEDVSASIGDADDKRAQNTKFLLEDREAAGISLLVFIGRYILDTLIYRNVETHCIYLPATFLSKLRSEAEQELRLAGDGKIRSVPFVSDGDLITAWGARMVLSSRAWKGSAAIYNIFDMRGRLAAFKSSPVSAYIQNLILPSTTLLTAEESGRLNVSLIALRVRRAIIEQTSESQVRSLMRITRFWISKLGIMPLFVNWDTTRVIACTNWTKAQLPNCADFGPAAIDANGKECVHSVKPVAYWGTTLSVTDNPRDAFVIYGKDHDGNYLVHGYLRKETWRLIKAELDHFTPS